MLEKENLGEFPLIKMDQVHGDRVHVQDNFQKSMIIPECDAIVTSQENIILAVKTADCLPILIYHPYPAIAVIHAGRVGTELNILEKTLKKMEAAYGINHGFSVWFGPCICKTCYPTDLIALNKGNSMVDQYIYSDYCTSCHNDLFFSYRKEQKTPKRFYSAIMLTPTFLEK
jgi:copper oxidase (laccase) domain-containing protein